MTSQTVMSNSASERSEVQTSLPKPEGASQDSGSTQHSNTPTNDLNGLSAPTSARVTKLPYQTNHQVELLHLQAEIEALLQQLQALKQQRLASENHLAEVSHAEMHALV